MKKRTLIQTGIISFFGGIIVTEIIGLWSFSIIIILVVLALGKNQRAFFLWIVLFFSLGVGRFALTTPSATNNHIINWRDKNFLVEVKGKIISDPETENNRQSFTLDLETLIYKTQHLPIQGKIHVTTGRYPLYNYGQLIKAKGQIEKPSSDGVFSYEKYLAKEDIWAIMNQAQIIPITSNTIRDGPIEYFWKSIFSLKHFLQAKIEEIFPAPDASIVLGLLLGLRTTIPEDILEDFKRAGLTHILAISGYNITLLITIITACCGTMERKKQTILIVVVISFFAIITGLSASVIRASLMGILVVTAMAFGKKTQGLHVLLLSAFLMAVQNPRILLWDISFQLSFLSTLGLLVLLPLCEKWFEQLPNVIKDNLPVTLAATIFTTPIILYYFGTFSFISLLTNIIFLPLIPITMLFSFAALVISFILLPLGQLLVGLNWLLMRLLIDGVDVFASLPFAAVELPPFPLWSIVMMYGAIGLLIRYKNKKVSSG